MMELTTFCTLGACVILIGHTFSNSHGKANSQSNGQTHGECYTFVCVGLLRYQTVKTGAGAAGLLLCASRFHEGCSDDSESNWYSYCAVRAMMWLCLLHRAVKTQHVAPL